MPELQLRSFGKSVLAAVLLGRWEDVFLEISKLSRFILSLIVKSLQSRKEKWRQWLEAPLVSGGPLPTPWTRLRMPIGPVGRSTLLMLRKVQRWQVLLGSLAASWLAYRSLRRTKLTERIEYYRKYSRLNQKVRDAETYAEWTTAIRKLHKLEGKNNDVITKWNKGTSLYDKELLQARLAHLRRIREEGDVAEMVYSLRTDMLRNLGNMSNREVYENVVDVPKPIFDYLAEVKLQLQYVTHYEFADFTVEDKLSFLRETRHAFGRTALVLSGGGALGTYHVGVVKTLFQRNLLPRILSGSSVGSLICAIVCTRSGKELEELLEKFCLLDLTFFNNSSLPQILKHFIAKGSFHDITFLSYRLRALLGDYTFQEAYEKSGRVLNVCVTAANTNEPPRLLNYLTAPNVVIWSAVAASSAFPFLFKPTDLLAKNRKGEFVKYVNIDKSHCSHRRWRDGSLEEDLPMQGISEMFNVNYFLVSQVNPHILPWLALKSYLNPKLAYLIISEWKHRCEQLMEILPSWFPKHALQVFCQRWEGDVTMCMQASMGNYIFMLMNSVMNPTSFSLKLAITEGERNTWPKLAAIEANCAIEQTLDECMSKLKKILRSNILKNRGRIPSWLNADVISRDNSVESLENHSDDDRTQNKLNVPHLDGLSNTYNNFK